MDFDDFGLQLPSQEVLPARKEFVDGSELCTSL